MKKEIKELFEGISDDELKQAIQEIKEDGETGFIREGVVREYAKLCSDIIGISTYTDLLMTEMCLLREAAYRWIK